MDNIKNIKMSEVLKVIQADLEFFKHKKGTDMLAPCIIQSRRGRAHLPRKNRDRDIGYPKQLSIYVGDARNIHMKKDKAYSVGLDVHDLDKQQIEEKCQHFIEKLKLHCEPCGLESVLQAFEELIFHLREIRLNVVFKSKV